MRVYNEITVTKHPNKQKGKQNEKLKYQYGNGLKP